ncbi:MAG: GNAT family N-acetyltransferase [Crocinitomicaceae bacterium]|nr:GNAT family N-acetyltransferase [Crocinitomicaceae bacterium]
MIRALTFTDIPGLNQLPPADWKFDYEDFLHQFMHEDFFYAFVLLKEGKIVGTGNVLLQEKTGWLGNIIVDQNSRGQGLGTKITQFLVDFLSDKGCETLVLIATELGEPIYRKIGFQKITDYLCFDSVSDLDYAPHPSIRPLQAADQKAVTLLDADINGENRTHLIHKFYTSGVGYFDATNTLLGFYLPHFGRGLVLSKDPKAGLELLQYKHTQQGKRTLLPVDNHEGATLLQKMGLTQGPNSCKMLLGKPNNWKPECIFSYGSGYCG